jgi:hypothetical protein
MTAWTTLKIAVAAPVPRPRVKIITVANPGFWASERRARRRSRWSVVIGSSVSCAIVQPQWRDIPASNCGRVKTPTRRDGG